MKRCNLLLTLAFLLTFVSCGAELSEEEEAKRQNDAFNMQGSWKLETTEGEEATLIVQNENSRSNIKVEILRKSLTNKETSFFSRHNIPLASVEEKFGETLKMGAGEHYKERGGENISRNSGETSEISLFTNSDEDLNLSEGKRIHYSLTGSVNRSDYKFTGHLQVRLDQYTKETNEKGEVVYYYKMIEVLTLSFSATNGGAYYAQYFGGWSGNFFIDDEFEQLNLDAARSLSISSVSSESFKVLAASNSLSFEGRTYRLASENLPIRDLKLDKFPLITFRYCADGDCLHFFGQIMSLGDLRGSIVHIDNTAEETFIGSFEYVKN